MSPAAGSRSTRTLEILYGVACAASLLFPSCKGSDSAGTPGTNPDAGTDVDAGSDVDGGTDVDAGKDGSVTPGNLQLWTQGMGSKVQPTTAQGTVTAVKLASYRDASAAYQIVVRAKGGALQAVRVAAGSLADGNGNTIDKANVALYRAAFIDFTKVKAYGGNLPVPANSPTKDGLIPDPLIPLLDPWSGADVGQPFNVTSGKNATLVIDIHVPKGIPAGTYTGTVQVSVGNKAAGEVPVSLTVWDLDLPDMRSVTTHFRMSVDDIIQYHKGTWACSGGTCWIDSNARSRLVVKRYEELAHSHRIDTSEQFVAMSHACTAPSDWTDYDKAIAPYMNGSYWSDTVPSGRLETPFSPGASWGLEADCTPQQYTALAAAWSAHLKAKGWFARAIVYAYDEPPASVVPAIGLDSSRLQAGDPDWKAHIMDTTAPTPSSADILNPALGIYAVALASYDTWNAHGPIYGRNEWPGLFAKGIKLWFYESNAQDAPYVTFATNSLDGLEPTMMMWGAWYEHASGFLYWDVASWDPKDPWGPTIAYGKTGDGVLLYPGNHDGRMAPAGSPQGVAIDGPIASYRLKMVRAGLQDWALFLLAEDKGLGDTVRQEVSAVYSQLGGCTYQGCPKPASGFFWKTDEAAMDQIRAKVVAAVIGK